ncbi:MAG: response regulator [Bacteroidota bacterium]
MSYTKVTILIVDDEESIRESFADYFEDLNYSVLKAASGEEALSLVTHHHVDGAIIDIRLPGMDGNELIQELNKLQPEAICVICTGSPEYKIPGNIDLPCGVKHVFTKPVSNLESMEKTLGQLIENKGGKEKLR